MKIIYLFPKKPKKLTIAQATQLLNRIGKAENGQPIAVTEDEMDFMLNEVSQWPPETLYDDYEDL